MISGLMPHTIIYFGLVLEFAADRRPHPDQGGENDHQHEPMISSEPSPSSGQMPNQVSIKPSLAPASHHELDSRTNT